MALVAGGAVRFGWLQAPDPITADEAVEVATDALRSADVDGRVAADASSGTYEPTSGDPVEVWKTVATLDGGGTISLWLAQDDGEPVFLDDRSPSGATQLLSDAQFDELADPAHDVRGERMLRNIVLHTAPGSRSEARSQGKEWI